jgi:hypothetical protein
MSPFRFLAPTLLLLCLCACQRPIMVPLSISEVSRRAAEALPGSSQPGFTEGFENGAAMVQAALREGRKPYFIRADANTTPPKLLSPLPDGVQVEDAAPTPEVDLATGLEVRGPNAPGSPFALGQEAGFRWGLSQFAQELSRKGLLAARSLPEVPVDWSQWPEQGDRVKFGAGSLTGEVIWFPGFMAWETAAKGFPPQRHWRIFPVQIKPTYVALKSDTLWLETREHGVMALDLESGAILRTQPAKPHDQSKGYNTYASYIDAERRKLQEPAQALRMKELRQRAALGEPQAMYALAKAMVISDQETDGMCPRIVWTIEAARRGHAQAMLEAAGIYFGGLGVPQDLAEARRWVDLAAATGNPEARLAREVMFPSKN